ncbi:cGMP-dependent 3',5'-cyclic phosphodiesterase-like [Coccinella septempunctata]|uniref:cGMP-dependent 3',5'-cyclic phosphodiesterase-like n=1 Tax=Coccinella septempunctata TaxID=41139 RepID=UPI001D086EC8|nr:cGMP-dependent 3',5'-cyclic phosphodiesterase-like [Coccinella septempunctata]
MEPLNPMRKMKKEREQNIFDAPPYCQKEFPVIPLVDECLPVPLRLEVSDATRIMYFMENFNGISSQELEFDINTYLKEACQASDVFIIHIMRISQQGRVQMLTDRVLENEVIMPLSRKTIDSIIKWDGRNYVCSKELDPEVRKICRAVMGKKGDPMHVIPILCRCRRDKDSTLRFHGNPVALVCLLNCEKIDYYVLRATQELFRYCSTTLINTMEGEEEARLKKNCHLLLEGSKSLFRNIHNLDKLVKEIMLSARNLTDAERCSLYLLDPEHLHWVSRVFSPEPAAGLLEVRIAMDQAIAAHVAAVGRTLNIPNAYEHPLFHRGEDAATGVRTRNILCFPIRDERELLVGVGQLSNKKNGTFDVFDEQIVEAFSMNCGISFMHSLMFRKLEECVTRSRMAQEIMIYKIQVTMEDVAQVLCCKTVHRIPYFDMYEFLTRSIITPETVCYVLRMFDDLDYLRKFKIRDITLIKFFLTIKNVYRENPFTNWQHGFATGHFVYCMLKQLGLVDNRYISPLEGLALLIAGFCHDVDHLGCTNPFILTTKSALANFFSSELCMKARHSLNQTLTILNLEGCNILEGLNDRDYNICIELIKDLILSTDLSIHLKLLYKQKKICTEFYQNFNSAHRYYLCSLLMTAADLSDFGKDWANTKRISWYLLEEFFKFGDMEKLREREPITAMNREHAKVPDLLVEFLEEICLPVFSIFSTLFPELETLRFNLEDNIEIWKRLIDYFVEQELSGRMGLDVLLSDGLDAEVHKIREEIRKEKLEAAVPIEEEEEEVQKIHEEGSNFSM